MTRWNRTLLVSTTAIAALFVAAIAVFAGWSGTSAGATIIVTSLDDTPPDGCNITGCTLREAIILANNTLGPDVIQLQTNGVYELEVFGFGEDLSAAGDLDILDDLTIRGNDTDLTTIDAGHIDRVFDVAPTGQDIRVRIEDMTIRDGYVLPGGIGGIVRNNAGFSLVVDDGLTLDNVVITGGDAEEGGGIYNSGELTIANSTVRNNLADFGAGVSNTGLLVLESSTVRDNPAAQSGGGIRNNDGAVNLFDSLITMNEAQNFGAGIDNRDNVSLVRSRVFNNNTTGAGGHGAGIYYDEELDLFESTIDFNISEMGAGGGIYNLGAVDVDRSTIDHNEAVEGAGLFNTPSGVAGFLNSTISGNRAATSGGGIFNDAADLTLVNVTIADNLADSDDNGSGIGGGILTDGGDVDVLLTLIGNNRVPGGAWDCSGPLDLQGFNLIGNTQGCTLNGSLLSSYFDVDPRIGALGPHGGPTMTHDLLPDSLAIDSESDDCPPPFVDQRGFVRPIDGNNNGLMTCDIGAYEYGAPLPSVTQSPTTPPTATPTPPPATPTPTTAPTAAPTDTPAPTGTAAPKVLQGDTRCDGEIESTDSLAVLRFIVGLDPLSQDEPCPDIGSLFLGDVFGDVLCDGAVDSVDALAISRFIAGLPPIDQGPSCIDIGDLLQ